MIAEDIQRFLFGILVSLPLSFALRFLPSLQIRKIYSTILGIILEYFVFDYPVVLAFGLHALVYIVIQKVKRQNCGFYITFLTMFLSSVYFIYVMIIDYGRWQLDISTILMMSVCKYSLFAFSYQDGQQEAKQPKINQQRNQMKIVELPTFADFVCYMVFLPTALGNTPFDYANFQAYMKKQKQFKDIPIKENLLRFGKELIGTLICLGIYIFSMIYFPISVFNEQSYIQKGALHHTWYSYIVINLYIFKYLFGFKLMQLPVHISGVSYKPTQNIENDQFQGIKTIDIYKFQTGFHIRDKVNSWNIAVQEWLRRCIYERLPYSKSVNQLLTFMVSAFWHGYYAGYYLTFGLIFLHIYANNKIFKFSRSCSDHPIIKFYRSKEKYLYPLIWLIWTGIFLTNGTYFVALSGKTAIKIITLTKFFAPLFLISLAIFFKLLTPKRKSTDKEQ